MIKAERMLRLKSLLAGRDSGTERDGTGLGRAVTHLGKQGQPRLLDRALGRFAQKAERELPVESHLAGQDSRIEREV